jgi:hypothetical protein
MPKQININLRAVPGTEAGETLIRFKQLAQRDPNQIKTLQRLMDLANIPKPL